MKPVRESKVAFVINVFMTFAMAIGLAISIKRNDTMHSLLFALWVVYFFMGAVEHILFTEE